MRRLGIPSLIAGIFSMAAAAASERLPVEVVDVSCALGNSATGTLGQEQLELTGLRPATRYALKLLEHGIDVRLAVAGDESRWINSEPWGYATEPIEATTNAEGDLVVRARIAKEFGWKRLQVELHCFDAGSSDQQAVFATQLRVADRMSRVIGAGDPLAALQATWDAAGMLWRTAPRSRERLWVLIQLSALATWGALPQSEIHWMRRAAAEADALGDDIRATLIGIALGGALLRSGDGAADATMLAALERARPLQLPDLEARAMHGHCIALRTLGDAESAADCYLGTIAAFAAIGDAIYEGAARNTRATALLFLGRYSEARQEIETAVALAERTGNELALARTLPVRAQMARWDGDFEQALALLNTSLTLHRRLGRTLDIERAESQIAHTYELAQEPARAELFYRSALSSAAKRGDPFAAASFELSLAVLLSGRGEHAAALALLDKATTVLAKESDASTYAYGMLHKAAIETAIGNEHAARSTLSVLADSAPTMRWRYRVQLDALRLQLGDAPSGFDAEVALEPMAMRALEHGDLTLFLDLGEALLRDRERRGDHAGVLHLVSLAMQRGFEVAAKVRSPMMRNSLLSKLKRFASAPLWLMEEGTISDQQAMRALANLESLREAEQRPPSSVTSNDSLVELERALADADRLAPAESPERERLLLEVLSAGASTTAADRSGWPAPGSLPADWPGREESILYLVVAGDRAGALIREDDRWHWHGDLGAAGIRAATHAIRNELAGGHTSRQAIDGQLEALAAALRWGDLFTRTPERLSLVLDGDLAGLPWSLLPAPGNAQRPLVESTRLTILQSLRPAPVERIRGVHAMAAGAPESDGLPALAQSALELDRVLEHWPGLPQRRSGRASRQELSAALADPGALVHIAAHGRGDHGRVEDAGLWLADTRNQPDFFSALRLRQMPVSATLVVLGACETGVGASGRSLGVGGVAGSLIDAGAGAVVGTRWPVSDRTALAFADAFHASLALQPLKPEDALQHALLELRRAPATRHPTHWAGWFLLRSGPAER